MSSAPEISRANPASFLFLIDQSGSMEQKIAGQADGISKMNAAADQVNRTIQAVAMRRSNPALTSTSIEESYLPISAVTDIARTETRPITGNFTALRFTYW